MSMMSAHFRDHFFITFDTPMRTDVISVRPILDGFFFGVLEEENTHNTEGEGVILELGVKILKKEGMYHFFVCERIF
jgi:hypothetical protein